MGADLYWKETPKPQEEQSHCLHMSTWYFLMDLNKVDDRMDMEGETMTVANLPTLNRIKIAARHSNNAELLEDMEELIAGIEKYESITLNILY